MRRCRLNGSDGQHCEDRSGVDPVKRCAAFFVSPVSPDPETRIGTAARALGVDRPCTGVMLTPTPIPNRTHAPSSLQNIRLRSDLANPFTSRCNQRSHWARYLRAG